MLQPGKNENKHQQSLPKLEKQRGLQSMRHSHRTKQMLGKGPGGADEDEEEEDRTVIMMMTVVAEVAAAILMIKACRIKVQKNVRRPEDGKGFFIVCIDRGSLSGAGSEMLGLQVCTATLGSRGLLPEQRNKWRL